MDPDPKPSREALDDARKAAIDCAYLAGFVFQAARSDGALPGAVRELLEPYRHDGPWVGPSPADVMLGSAIDGLCGRLDAGQGKVDAVEGHLLARASEPVSIGGLTRSTAHRLAWDYAHRLWLLIRGAVPELEIEDARRVLEGERPGFGLDSEAIRANAGQVRAVLLAQPPFDAPRLVAMIQIESAGAGVPSAAPPISDGWLEGSRSLLNRALGKSGNYSDYLEREARRNRIVLRRVGKRFRIYIHDDADRAKAAAWMAKYRGDDHTPV